MPSVDVSSLSAQTTQAATDVDNAMNSVDGNDPATLMNLQAEMGKYQTLYSTLSAVISDIKQTCQGVAQKM